MKLIAIYPTFDEPRAGDERSDAYFDEVANVCIKAMKPSGYEHLIAYWWHNEHEPLHWEAAISLAPIGTKAGVKMIAPVPDEYLFNFFRKSLDPDDEFCLQVKCATSCRQFTTNYDGDAFLCLRYDDPVPKHTELIQISDRSQDLIQTDWHDGICPDFSGRL